ncbi:DUF6379 domain-containing protein [Phycicoccus sp. Soil803]|uniref:C-glycoside deglycosidase beta subunit domain-containing protein n=1 Tax=Phycicoccus sp. Soil803 TaxID=1736415 RepID=UPI00070C02A9|nr:DUF6379 domain-containing protein [Phycicoccus sp. Soil803]KRF25985.1 hypothetical protein ASG95_17050 [Phycicoccus sp. Soil803]
MFDKYIICEDSLRATDAGQPGAQVEVRLPYYRGLGLSMVEAVDVSVDGVAVDPERTTLSVHGQTYRFPELGGVLDDRWEMGERAVLGFALDRPLTPGDHQVDVTVRLRISYMPVPGGGRDSKRLVLQD